MPYVWAAGIEGDVTIGAREIDVDVGFDDLLDKTDVAGSVIVRMNYNRLLFMGQIDFFSLSTDEIETRRGDVGINGELESDTTIWTAAVGYRFDGWSPDQTIGVLLGARHIGLDNTLSLDTIGRFERDRDVTDGVLVLLPYLPLSENWAFSPNASIGTGDSDLTWELWPQFQYTNGALAARIGYRRIHYDIQDDNDNEFDAAFHGLTLGIGFTF